MTCPSRASIATVAAASLVAFLPSIALANGGAPVPESPPTAPASSAHSFAGPYIGLGLVGAGNGDDRVGITLPGDIVGNAGKLSMQGAMGQLALGYRFPLSNGETTAVPVLIGLELDIQSGRVEDSDSAVGVDSTSRVKRLTTLRAQVGVPVREDLLVYGFYGVVRTKVDYSAQGVFGGTPVDISERYSANGSTYGVGIEYAFSDDWSVRGELGVTDLGVTELTGAGGEFTEATPSWTSLSIAAVYRF